MFESCHLLFLCSGFAERWFLRVNWRNVEIQYMDVHCGRGQFSSNNHPLARWFHQWKSYLEIHGSTWIETRETRFVVLNLWSLHLVPYWQLMWVAYQVFLIHSVLLCSIIKDIICLSEYGTAVWRMKSRYYTNRLWKPSYSIRATKMIWVAMSIISRKLRSRS